MSRPLSYRRAQEKRALHKAYKVVREWYPLGSFHRSGTYGTRRGWFTPEDRWDMARRMRDNRKRCAGDCCKNPRRTKWHSITIQEQKALEDYKSQLEDLPS